MVALAQKPKKTPTTYGVVKPILRVGNYYVLSKHDLGLFEQKLICAVGYYLQKTNIDVLEVTLYAKDIVEILHMTKSAYKQIDPVITKLMQSIIDIRDENGWTKVAFFSKAKYQKGSGKLILTLTEEAKKFFIDLVGNYTKLEMTSIVSQNSAYALKMYSMFKSQYQLNRFEFTWNVQEIRDFFCLDEKHYRKYSHLKSKIILVIQKELKGKTEIAFDFEEVKDGRSVTAIKFKLKKNTPQLLIPYPVESDEDAIAKDRRLDEAFEKRRVAKKTSTEIMSYFEFVESLRLRSNFSIGSNRFLKIEYLDENREIELGFDAKGRLYNRESGRNLTTSEAENIYKKVYQKYQENIPAFTKTYFLNPNLGAGQQTKKMED